MTVVSIDELDRAGDVSIINSDTAASGGKHWTAIYCLRNQCWFFDPFGLAPDTRIVKWAKGNSNRPFHYNTLQKQDIEDTDCGRRCYSFLIKMHNAKNKMNQFKEICGVEV